ncbi:MAG: hypothetical protein Q8P01_04740 [bacterium]|nr:hypothetical protein [bacterium]
MLKTVGNKSMSRLNLDIGGKKPKVFVATYTNEGLKFQMVLGPLKFEPSKRGRRPLLPVTTI